MIYLKIITQILTGVAVLVALLLDYKWQDKRRKVFKQLRNVLIILSIGSLIAGVVITLNDERDRNNEVLTLKSTLEYIKSNGDSVKSQIKPFLDLATRKYPNLSSNEALEKLRSKIEDLDKLVLSGSEKITHYLPN